MSGFLHLKGILEKVLEVSSDKCLMRINLAFQKSLGLPLLSCIALWHRVNLTCTRIASHFLFTTSWVVNAAVCFWTYRWHLLLWNEPLASQVDTCSCQVSKTELTDACCPFSVEQQPTAGRKRIWCFGGVNWGMTVLNAKLLCLQRRKNILLLFIGVS